MTMIWTAFVLKTRAVRCWRDAVFQVRNLCSPHRPSLRNYLVVIEGADIFRCLREQPKTVGAGINESAGVNRVAEVVSAAHKSPRGLVLLKMGGRP